MTWKKRIVLSVTTGVALTGVGIGLVSIGGWGPCGPASTVSALGGYLCIEHLAFWSTIFPRLEEGLAALHVPDSVSAIVVPAIDFSALTFFALCFASLPRKGKPNKSPEPTPGSVTPAAPAPGAPPPSSAQL